jgi:type I restriction-modification system DNA methylase subunit
MSEELLQTLPQQIGKYTYYRLGSTTLEQLKNNGIIPAKNYKTLKVKRPDGLVIYHGAIKAVVEYKQPKELKSEKDLKTAISQEIKVAKILCKVLIITDSTKSFWINALSGEPIKDAAGNDIKTIFHPFVVKNVGTLEYLLSEIDASITATSSIIKSAKLIDPTPLATRLWQTIWVATGKSPVKCLYNVVELFIFKFLSDLQILSEDIAFAHIREKASANAEKALEFYAKNTRSKIYKLFPHGKDNTTIINGTIFVTESGEPNLSQAILFSRCLDHLQKYSEEFGSLTKIDKQFKTKLYESFLKQEVEALGQYFTPRRVIQSIIRMAGIDEPSFQFEGKRFCDPFCGVGGFPLEMLNLNEGMQKCYTPDDNKVITLPFVVNGFDKGFERDDERTIIMAKANMLIYLAELLFANPQCSTEFARIFNETFTLFKDNLGTFGHIIKKEEEKYDYILSNPPYVTSGSSIIKEELRKTPCTVNEYPINALGLEGLSLEWIIKSLKKGGKAFIIIPDGILARTGGKKLRNYILDECFLDALVSLPLRTFFANSKHTFVLAVTKKNNPEDIQIEPVFTYLVSNIGERLTSVKRDEIEEDDLPEMEAFFKIFSGAKSDCKKLLEKESLRCKIQDITRFRESPHWIIDRWWTWEERIALHLEDSPDSVSKYEIDVLQTEFNASLNDYEQLKSQKEFKSISMKKVALGNKTFFNIFIGKRVLKRDLLTGAQGGGIPVYSANVFEPLGLIEESNIENFTLPTILWGIDGNFELRHMPQDEVFATTDHCGIIQILDPSIVPDYLLYALTRQKEEESFDRSFRASLANMGRFVVPIPIGDDGNFDIDAQQKIASRFLLSKQKQQQLQGLKAQIDELFSHYFTAPKVVDF